MGQPRRGSPRAQYLDWVWGLNPSMAYQALLRKSNVGVGRVQTPVLEMVDARRRAIENFKPTDYFIPVITLRDGTVMRWHKREEAAGTPGFDLEGRIIDEQVAKQIVRAITGGLKGTCVQATAKEHSEKPPLPFSLGALQAEAARQHGMTLDEVTDAAQNLYKSKAISYVGTDCRFLPESMHADARKVMAQLAKLFPGQAQGAHMEIKGAAFNDAKLDEHFAIVRWGFQTAARAATSWPSSARSPSGSWPSSTRTTSTSSTRSSAGLARTSSVLAKSRRSARAGRKSRRTASPAARRKRVPAATAMSAVKCKGFADE